MRWVIGTFAATGIVGAIAAPMGIAQARMGGSFHSGMGFHGGFHKHGLHHHPGFFPGYGVGLAPLYGAYGSPGYDYNANPYYGEPNPQYGPYPYPNYGGTYPMRAPYASGSASGYATPTLDTNTLDTTDSRLSSEPNLALVEVKPSATPATRDLPKPTASDSAVDPRLPDVRLTGIVLEGDRRVAIFAVTGTGPLVLSEGEALKDWRVDSISQQKVSLSGPAGTMTLELFSPGRLPG